MSEFNFDKMRNLKIPDEWAESTINKANELRSKSVNAPAFPVRSVVYLCLLIVLIIGAFTFSLPQSNVGIDVLDNSYTLETCKNSNSKIEPSKENEDTETLAQSKIEETKESKTEETEKSDDDFAVEPTEKVSDNETKPDSKPASKPATSKPAEVETEDVTEAIEQNKNDYFITMTLNNDTLTENGNIYCMTSCNGVNMGSNELKSPQHEVEIVEKTSSYTRVKYYPYRQNVVTKSGYNLYIFSFYNEDGLSVAEMGIYLDS